MSSGDDEPTEIRIVRKTPGKEAGKIATVNCTACGKPVRMYEDKVGTRLECPKCHEEFTAPLTTVAAGLVTGDFWLQRYLGAGCIAEVFQAKRVSTGERVLVKVLSPKFTRDRDNVDRYLLAMLQWAELDVPELLPVHEVGQLKDHQYLASPYVEGESLKDRVERAGPMESGEALKLILRLATALGKCWKSHGLVHCDIRPSNVIIDASGDPHLTDVGNCKQYLLDQKISFESMNNTGDVAAYISPEQVLGGELDCATDIYSLGAVFYYLLLGKPPYEGELDDVTESHLHARFPMEARKSLSKPMSKLLAEMLRTPGSDAIYTWEDAIARMKQISKGGARPKTVPGAKKVVVTKTTAQRIRQSSKIMSTKKGKR